MRWLEDEEKVRRWRKKAFDREKWESIYGSILYHCTRIYGCMFMYAYCYVCSVLGILFHCVVLCIVCV